MTIFKFKKWELILAFDNPFRVGAFEFLSINWETGWAYYLTICNVVVGLVKRF